MDSMHRMHKRFGMVTSDFDFAQVFVCISDKHNIKLKQCFLRKTMSPQPFSN